VEVERWRTIEEIYSAALEMGVEERPAFLDQRCGSDESLKDAVRSLLDYSEDGDTFLEAPALGVAARALAKTAGDRLSKLHPSEIGRYRIIRELGEGGMGIVYEAEQDHPRRRVALKVIKLGLAAGERLRRFEHESQALARLQHPGIAQIYEASTADTGFGPQPYFAMELVRGLPLAEYAKEKNLNVRQRLALMVKVCEAVNHAHQRGLIHRDLKPDNILVDENGQPKVLDFGVARLTQADGSEPAAPLTVQTSLGELIGTLAYMSPEQVLGDPLEVDTRSDVYALGVILYELLAGRLPYDVHHRQLPEAVQTIREREPAGLGTLNRAYRGDVETIVKKALEKDKAQRYASAAELGADIERYLKDEAIVARPPSARYQLQKFARRHRGLMASIAAVFVVLLAGIAVATSMAIRASRAESEARAVNDFLQNDLLAQAGSSTQAGPNSKPDPHLEVRTALDRAAARIPGKFPKQPLVEAALRQTIGFTYQDLGLYGEAQQQQERALAIRERILGETNPATWESIDHLAILYRLEGKYAEAEPLRKRLLELQRRALGELNSDTLDAMNNLAVLYRYEGKPQLAEPLYVEAVARLRRLKGVERQALLTMANLAQLYGDEAKYAQSEQLFDEALQGAPRVLGDDNPVTLAIMGNLGQVYQNEGKLAQAVSLQKKTLDAETRVLGAEHPQTLMSMGNLAKMYRNEGKYAEAEALFTSVLDTQHRVLGDDQPATLVSMNLLGTVKWYEGNYAAAEQLFVRAVDGDRRLLGNRHPQTLNSLVWLGRAQLPLGKYGPAEASFREAMNGYQKAGPAAWERFHAQSLLGESLAAERKYAEAEPLLVSGYEGLRERRDKLPAMSRREVESAAEQIVRLYEDWHKADKAQEWRAKLETGGLAPK
jgi:eukaryotic-like serine/threonine-protein kinase